MLRLGRIGVLLLGLGVAGLFAIAFCIYLFLPSGVVRPSPYDLDFLPVYPGAQEVQLRTAPKVTYGSDSYYPNGTPYKTLTFTTQDIPDEVFTFYKKQLADRYTDGWRLDLAELRDNKLHIVGFDNRQRSGPMYYFDITAEPQAGTTHVKIERTWIPGE